MILGKYLSSLVVLCVTTPSFCAENTLRIRIEVTPGWYYEGRNKTIQIRCFFTGNYTDAPFSYIRLTFWESLSHRTKKLAEVTELSASITDPTLTQRASLSGKVKTNRISSYLDLTIRNTTCSDVGSYSCWTSYKLDGIGSFHKSSQFIMSGLSQPRPQDLEVRKEPQKTTYLVGDDVTFICSGKVGKPAQNWTWQNYDDVNGVWTNYTANVSTDTPRNFSNCAYSGVSRLTYRIRDELEHKFRCIVGDSVNNSITMSIKGVSFTLETSRSPDTVYDGKTKTLRIRCNFLGTLGDKTVHNLKLDFKKTSSDTKQLAQVIGETPSITDPTLTSRATVTGTIYAAATSSYLELSVGNVSCADVGFYTCKTNFTYPNGTQSSIQKQAEVEGRSYPVQPEVKTDPVNPKYPIGEQVTITCSGKVGKPQNSWQWQEYDEDERIWKTVTNGVTNDTASLVTDCAYHAVSKLRYLVEDDREHKFRCNVGNESVTTSINQSIIGEVSGAGFLLISPVLLFCTVFLTIWRWNAEQGEVTIG